LPDGNIEAGKGSRRIFPDDLFSLFMERFPDDMQEDIHFHAEYAENRTGSDRIGHDIASAMFNGKGRERDIKKLQPLMFLFQCGSVIYDVALLGKLCRVEFDAFSVKRNQDVYLAP
jgi:hypothetical protein